MCTINISHSDIMVENREIPIKSTISDGSILN
jgi:hypothetical protein